MIALLGQEVPWEVASVVAGDVSAALRDAHYIAIQAYAPLEASAALAEVRVAVENAFGPTTANLGPRYLHSTGQLHKGGPSHVVGVQIIQRPHSDPVRIAGRAYSFHDLHMAQAIGDQRAMLAAGRPVVQLMVDDVAEAAATLGLDS